MSKVTVILPIHEFGENLKKYIDSAIKSVLDQLDIQPKILVVYTHRAEEGGLLSFLESQNYGENLTTIKNIEKTDFCGQINFGVKNIDTEYFSILEYDDEYSRIYFRNVEKYISTMTDVSMFLPITIDVDDKTNTPLQLVNQNIWSKGYVGENGSVGYLNSRSLNEFNFYTIGGSVIKKSDFIGVGGLKSNIVLTFTFEFLLRFLNNGNKIYTIPKFGYKHIINRDGSLFMGYVASLSEKDRYFWFETAKKESHFFNDRMIDTTKEIVVETPAQ